MARVASARVRFRFGHRRARGLVTTAGGGIFEEMPTVAAKKNCAPAAMLARRPRRLPAFMKTDKATGLAVAKARPGVRVLSTAEVRALADA